MERACQLIAASVAAICSGRAVENLPPERCRQLLRNVDFSKAAPIDEGYRAEFEHCDNSDAFRGQSVTGWHKCANDKNRVRALLKLVDGAIYYESKLALDLDGSWKASHNKGRADQRATWYQWPRSCHSNQRDSSGLCETKQVDAEQFPFIVIPIAGPKDLAGEFRQKTGLAKGDFGVLIYGAKWVPAFVADGGPYNKLGEGSAAAFRELGQDRCLRRNDQGFCDAYHDESVPEGVVTIIFPGSRRDGMTRDTAIQWMCQAAKERLGLIDSPVCAEHSVSARVKKIIVEHLGVDASKVRPEAALRDLGADDLDRVELSMACEEEFNISIRDSDADNWQTVNDVIRTVLTATN